MRRGKRVHNDKDCNVCDKMFFEIRNDKYHDQVQAGTNVTCSKCNTVWVVKLGTYSFDFEEKRDVTLWCKYCKDDIIPNIDIKNKQVDFECRVCGLWLGGNKLRSVKIEC